MKRAMNQSPAVKGGLSVTMSKLFAIFVLCLAVPALSLAQDPLSPSYLPAIDTNPADYPSNIWVTDTMQKVLQGSGSPGNAHWGTFYGTQGEFVDFQVHVQAPAGGYAALTIASSDFVQTSPSSFTIPAPSASNNDIVVYREAYLNITNKSATAPVYYNVTGYYPDPLIPAIDPYYHQVTNAFPVAVTANQNQSAWIDVFIPQNAPSGYYLGHDHGVEWWHDARNATDYHWRVAVAFLARWSHALDFDASQHNTVWLGRFLQCSLRRYGILQR